MQKPQPRVPADIAGVFDAVLAEAPGREALVTASGRWSYADLDRAADRAAAALSSLGIGPGDRVAACLPNDAEVVTAFHGAMRLGAVWVGVNQALAPPEKAFLLSDSGAAVMLCGPVVAGQLAGHRSDLPALREVVVAGGEVPAGVGVAGRWEEVVAAAPPAPPRVAVDPDAPAAIAYTSGTTGHPKGAVHSQHNLLVPGAALAASRGWGADLRKGDCLPLTILNMLVLTTLAVAQAGGSCIVMDRIDAAGVAEWIERERVTVWNGVPAILYTMSHDDTISASALESLREVWAGGADCPESLRSAFARKFGRPVLCTYGLTEAPTVVTIDGPDGDHREGASGLPLPHLAVRILDGDGRPAAAGEAGEICLAPVDAGPWAGVYRPPRGYWERPGPTAELLAGGVVHTGDVGYLGPDGFLFVRDRKNQLIIRGGANVYPAEVERVLVAFEGVAAAAVVGIPDERLGQRVVAAVQLEPGVAADPEALREHCGAQLARYKVPERIEFVDAFTRNSMGKIDRRSLAALFE